MFKDTRLFVAQVNCEFVIDKKSVHYRKVVYNHLQKESFYSVRMRSAQGGAHEQGGKHISGGERISTYDELKDNIKDLVEKALTHSRGNPDFLQIQFDKQVKTLKPLPVATNEVSTVADGYVVAKKLLVKSGVPLSSIEKAYDEITEYSNLRGAILFDIRTGKRIDSYKEKGVRVSRMDWPHVNFEKWTSYHDIPMSERVKEAMALATKVCAHPATIAELCWSDDPEYTTGYVASSKLGYQRITKLKQVGDERGCRIFFVNNLRDVSSYTKYLEKQPIFLHWEEEE